jgi:hypothetical protein
MFSEKGIDHLPRGNSHLSSETAVKQFPPVHWNKSRNFKPFGVSDMFPSLIEETLGPKQFALMLSSRIGKTGMPLKYWQAIRLMDKFGGYTVTNDNSEYKRREITKSRALEIIAKIKVPVNTGGRP